MNLNRLLEGKMAGPLDKSKINFKAFTKITKASRMFSINQILLFFIIIDHISQKDIEFNIEIIVYF